MLVTLRRESLRIKKFNKDIKMYGRACTFDDFKRDFNKIFTPSSKVPKSMIKYSERNVQNYYVRQM
jgi:hypothetical protein